MCTNWHRTKRYPSKLLISSSSSSNFSTASSSKNKKQHSLEGGDRVLVTGGPASHQLNVSAAAAATTALPYYVEQSALPALIISSSSSSSINRPAATTTAAYAQSPEYMSIQDLMSAPPMHVVGGQVKRAMPCFQELPQSVPPTPLDVALVEDLRFCFSLRKTANTQDNSLGSDKNRPNPNNVNAVHQHQNG